MLSVLFVQCEGLFKDDDLLSLPLTPYTGNQLHIDGYYYQIMDEPSLMDGILYGEGSIGMCYFFYENGIVLYLGGRGNSLEGMDEYVIRAMGSQNYKNIKFLWGVFVAEDSIIKIDSWFPGPKPYKAYVMEGIVLNDTTFQITKSYRSNGSELREKDEIYYFREFSPKPDSTNKYIK